MAGCKCNVSLSNTGTPNCQPIASVTRKIILVSYYASDGSVNGIDLTATLDQTYIDGKLNAANSLDRWFPLPNIKNITDERGDSVFEEFNDGTRAFIRQGARTFTGIIPAQSTNYLAKLSGWKCVKKGVFIIDNDGNLIGSKKVSGMLYPIKIEDASFDVRLIKATDSTVQKLQVSFNYDLSERDEDLRMILSSEMSFDPLTINGLIDVYGYYVNVSTAGFDLVLTTDFGSVINPIKVEGVQASEFTVYDDTNSVTVSIASVSENAGVYTFTFSAPQTSGTQMHVEITKNGLDDEPLSNVTFTIP